MMAALCFGLVASVAGCQCDDSLGALSGNVRVEPEALDFGKAALGSTKLLPLTIRNKGTFRLQLSGFETAAPFVAPSGSATVATGNVLTREIGFRPVALGPASGTLTITTDDPDAPTVLVALTGEGIEAAVRVEPLAIDFGEVLWDAATRPATRSITVSNPGSDAFELTAIELAEDGGGAFAVDPASALESYAPGQSKTFTVTYTPNAMGAVAGRLRLSTTAPAAPEVFVTLAARAVGPALEVCSGPSGGPEACTARGEAPRIDLGLVELGQTGRGAIRVLNVGDRPLSAQLQPLGQTERFVFSPDPAMLGSFMVAPGGEQRFDVTWTPTDYQFDSINVSVGSSAAVRRSAVVRVEGRVPKAVAHLEPRTLTFTLDGRVPSAQARVKLQNCGDLALTLTADLRIRAMQGPAEAFSLVGAPRRGDSIAPGRCAPDAPGAEFDVVFRPAADGLYRAAVEVETTDPADPLVTVELAGDKRP
jgi:hypothetical protein